MTIKSNDSISNNRDNDAKAFMGWNRLLLIMVYRFKTFSYRT